MQRDFDQEMKSIFCVVRCEIRCMNWNCMNLRRLWLAENALSRLCPVFTYELLVTASQNSNMYCLGARMENWSPKKTVRVEKRLEQNLGYESDDLTSKTVVILVLWCWWRCHTCRLCLSLSWERKIKRKKSEVRVENWKIGSGKWKTTFGYHFLSDKHILGHSLVMLHFRMETFLSLG